MDIKELHEKILYPAVRVRTEKVRGSGSVIYSKPSKSNPDEYETFILTNHHVVEAAIQTKKEWDSVAKKDIKKDFLSQVTVEIFDYVNLSTVNSSNSHKADIIAYDKAHDLAVLKLDSPKPVQYVAKLIPKEKIKDLRLFMPIIGCGCSLLHDPFATEGRITSLKEVIDNKVYMMTSHNSIFGNSGGAVYLAETGEQIGVTARITAIQLGFGIDVLTWMGFSVAPQRIYEFLDEQELKFIYNPKDSFEAAMKRRKAKEQKMKLQGARGEEEGEEDEGDEMSPV
jgi:S1-C subfamily serine protease